MELYERYYDIIYGNANKLIDVAFSPNIENSFKDYIYKEFENAKYSKEFALLNYYYVLFNSSVAFMGINKELINSLNIHNNYNYEEENATIKGSGANDKHNLITDITLEKFRKIKTKFDYFMAIEKCIKSSNYIDIIRDGLLHSNFSPFDRLGTIFYVNTNHYSNLSAKINNDMFSKFINFYFGNSFYIDYYTVNSDLFLININNTILNGDNITYYNGEKVEINNKIDLEFILDNIILSFFDYDNNSDKMISKNIYNYVNEKGLLVRDIKKDFKFNDVYLSDIDKNILMRLIDEIPDFYSFDLIDQLHYIKTIYNVFNHPNNAISNQLSFFVNYTLSPLKYNTIPDLNNLIYEPNSFKLTSLIMKLYAILYRIQYKSFDEINYNFLEFSDNIIYNEDGIIDDKKTYEHFFSKLKNNNPTKSDEELKKKLYLNIIRDSLCHSSFRFDYIDDEIKIIFIDNFKKTSRSLTMNIDDLKLFTESSCFYPNYLIENESVIKLTRRKD